MRNARDIGMFLILELELEISKLLSIAYFANVEDIGYESIKYFAITNAHSRDYFAYVRA